MPSKVQLTGGVFQDAQGNPLVSGYLRMVLNQDESVTGVGLVAAGIEININLNASGSVDTVTPQYVWGNDQMLPVNSYYRVTGYTAAGQPAWGPNNQQVTGNGGTFDVGSWTPNSVISWTPAPSTPLLQTNGVTNDTQAVLDIQQGTGTTITETAGVVTISASGGPTLETNGVANGSQTTLNLKSGTGVTLTNSGPDVTVNGAYVAGSGISITGATIAATGGGGAVQTATVNLSSADLIALRSTPKTLVAGQAGKTIVPLFYQLVYTFVTAPYTGVSANNFNIFPGTDITLAWDYGVGATGFVDQSSDKIVFCNPVAPINQGAFPAPQALASFQGQALSLGFGANQGPAPLSGGSGTMVATVYYIVV